MCTLFNRNTKLFLHEWQWDRLVALGCGCEEHIQQNVTVHRTIIIQIGRSAVNMIMSA